MKKLLVVIRFYGSCRWRFGHKSKRGKNTSGRQKWLCKQNFQPPKK